VVVVLAFIELVDSLTAFKMIPAQKPSLFKLRENAVDRGQADIGVVIEQMFEHIFGRHMPLRALLKDFQNLLPGYGGLQSSAFEFVHEFSVAIEREGALAEGTSPKAKCYRYNDLIIWPAKHP
jgi:hypothetical protein